jgi:hypothetical protein
LRRQQGPALGGVTRQSWISLGEEKWWTTIELNDYSSPYSPLKIEDIWWYMMIYIYMGVDEFDPVKNHVLICFQKMIWSCFDHDWPITDPGTTNAQRKSGSCRSCGAFFQGSPNLSHCGLASTLCSRIGHRLGVR